MKNTEPQQVKFEDIYQPHWHQLRKYENYLSIHNGHCIYISPEATTQEISQLFDKVGFYNKRENPYNYITRSSEYYNYLMDTKLSNMIQPNSITLDAYDAIDMWENGKLKFCHMFIEQEKRQRGKVFPYKNNRGEYYNNQMCVDTTPRCLCNKIKINIVVDDGDYHLHCNQYGLPEYAYINQEKINGIKVNQEHLLEIINQTEFQFFAQKGEKYNGTEINSERPITLQMQGEKMVIASFFDINGNKIDCLENKNQKQTINDQKELAIETLQKIQEKKKKYKYAVSFKKKPFETIEQEIKSTEDIDKLCNINNLLTKNLIAHQNLQEINNIEETNQDRCRQHNKEQIIKTFDGLFDVLKIDKTYKKTKTNITKKTNNQYIIEKDKPDYGEWFIRHSGPINDIQKNTEAETNNEDKIERIGDYQSWFMKHSRQTKNIKKNETENKSKFDYFKEYDKELKAKKKADKNSSKKSNQKKIYGQIEINKNKQYKKNEVKMKNTRINIQKMREVYNEYLDKKNNKTKKNEQVKHHAQRDRSVL